MAADDLRARMRAQVFGEGDVARLVEGADQVAGLEHRAQHRGGIGGIGAQIAVAQIVRREQRHAARQIQNDVARRHGAVARRSEGEGTSRRRRRRGVVVDHHLERAEMALGRPDRALDHRKLGDARRRDAVRVGDQHRDVEMLLEQVCGFDRFFVAAVDQRDAFARQADARQLRQRLGRNCNKRSHLRTGVGGVLRPACGFADVGERQRCAFAGQFGEQRRFLGAADHNRPAALRQLAESLGLVAAEKAGGLDGCALAGATDRVRVERHGVLARTHQDGRFLRHCAPLLAAPDHPPLVLAPTRL